jgi:hypothetical protein
VRSNLPAQECGDLDLVAALGLAPAFLLLPFLLPSPDAARNQVQEAADRQGADDVVGPAVAHLDQIATFTRPVRLTES